MFPSKRKAVLGRIESLEDAIGKTREYLEDGKHAHWPGFRPLFASKMRGGKELPPHKDWVKNVFLPHMEKALSRAEKTLEGLDKAAAVKKRLPCRNWGVSHETEFPRAAGQQLIEESTDR